MSTYLSPLFWVFESYLKYNPFFIYGGRTPLLHQTEVVAKSLFLRPSRMLVADVIGLGKTITAIRLLKTMDNYSRLERVLIVVPSVLVGQWVDEVRSMGVSPEVIDRDKLGYYKSLLTLPSGWYIGSVDTLKRPEYMDLLVRNRWDAIVVDEAHKLGIIGSTPNQRWENIGRLIRDNRDAILILLSATPHRGKASDYMARLGLIDPTLLEKSDPSRLEKRLDRPEFYQNTHDTIVFRRSKEDVNRVYEKREVFKPCNMLAVLIEPNDVERQLLRTITELATSYLSKYYSLMLELSGWSTGRVQGIIALLRTILVKRGLSSPVALIKTFSRLVEKRAMYHELIEKGYDPEEAERIIIEELEKASREWDEILTGDVGEYESELDERFDNIARSFEYLVEEKLDEEFRMKLDSALEAARRILYGDVQDSKLETLKRILRLVVLGDPEEVPEEYRDIVSGKAIVFTEFKDTAKYLYDRLRKWAEEEVGAQDVVRVFSSDNQKEIEDLKSWLAGEGKRVLITTDVAGEGLNLQHANVLVNYEIVWSPVRLEQRIGRVWRYGQKRPTYVFNLFFADALEREVADIVFAKLYGIITSLGKLEPILGEKVLFSTLRNEVLEHAVEEKGFAGFVPLEIEFRGRKLFLSETRIIDLIARDARAFVLAFIRALKDLISEIKVKRIYPECVDAEKVRRELKFLVGFGDTREAVEAAETMLEFLRDAMGAEVEERGGKFLVRLASGKMFYVPGDDPEKILRSVMRNVSADKADYFVFQSPEKKVVLLCEIALSYEDRVLYREPVGIVADLDTRDLRIVRGLNLVKLLKDVLSRSLLVDEIFGLDSVMGMIPKILKAAMNTFTAREVLNGVGKRLRGLERYEEFKKRVEVGESFFETSMPKLEIGEPRFIFVSNMFLPEVEEALSYQVWGWAEDEALPVVFNFEGLGGREATRVSGHEHYDVYSVKRDRDGRVVEERYIEVKTKMSRDLAVSLTEKESMVARKRGDKYWLYIVYGARTEAPVLLAVKNPLGRLPFRRRVEVEKREKYYFFVGDSS